MTDRKPRLTNKVLRGLAHVMAQIEAGTALDEDGELYEDRDDIEAASAWVWAMRRHRIAHKEGT